ALPGVRGSGLALYNPLTDNWGEGILVAGRPPPKPGEQAGASWDRVSVNYLQNLGMTMVRGRTFTTADNETTANVAIVNEAFVKRFFKSDEDPIDQHFGLDLPENVGTFRIVGVVRDAKFASFALDQPARPMFFVPLAHAAVGLYGVTAYTVAQRTNEIGIRMALGADRGKVVDLVLRGAFKRVVAGLVLGLPLAVGAGRLLAAQLYGVSFWDPLALAV